MKLVSAAGRLLRMKHRWTRLAYVEGYAHGYLDGHSDSCSGRVSCPE